MRLLILTSSRGNPLAEWLSQDPLAESVGVNLYEYVSNNPVMAIDPLGLFTDKEYQQAMNVATSGAAADAAAMQAALSGDSAAYKAAMSSDPIWGKAGQSLGENSLIDEWENSPESWEMGIAQATEVPYAAFVFSPNDSKIVTANAEYRRQLSLIDFLKKKLKEKQAAASCKKS